MARVLRKHQKEGLNPGLVKRRESLDSERPLKREDKHIHRVCVGTSSVRATTLEEGVKPRGWGPALSQDTTLSSPFLSSPLVLGACFCFPLAFQAQAKKRWGLQFSSGPAHTQLQLGPLAVRGPGCVTGGPLF